MTHHPILQRGSALIITMLVVTAISATAFGLSRIFLADVRIAASLEDSLKAYYTAEAGVEEGLLRYRIDRNNTQLNDTVTPVTRTLVDGNYTMVTTFLARAALAAGRVSGTVSFDTEIDSNPDYPGGNVDQDETVEIYAPSSAGNVQLSWVWSRTPSADDQGLEITTVHPNGTFDKVLIPRTQLVAQVPSADREAIRVKPLGGELDWIAFGASPAPGSIPIGRTIQTIDATGTVGRAKRRLEATLSRRSGSIVGLFDFVLGSEEDLIRP
jgi:hypothetical protein